MTDTSAALAVLTGLALRLIVPLLLTALIVVALTRLDKRWQDEAGATPVKVKKPECWKTNNCPTDKRSQCAGFKSPLPCWQVFRMSNGYLDERCIGCPVLVAAPVPSPAQIIP